MKVVTEIELREVYKNHPFKTYRLNQGERLTPAASQFLSERLIKVINGDVFTERNDLVNTLDNKKKRIDLKKIQMPKKGYICLPSGKLVDKKPEYYTHLKGNILVPKNHPRIKLRGTLDLTEANLICCINQIKFYGYNEMGDDLVIVLEYLQKMMRAEVLGEELPFIEFKGWTDDQIREYSHYPDKYFGVKHILPSAKYGQIFANINQIRTMIRQLELAAVEAFYNEEEDTCERLDIIMALNRLSSLIYIMTCKFLGGQYKV